MIVIEVSYDFTADDHTKTVFFDLMAAYITRYTGTSIDNALPYNFYFLF